MRVARVQHTLTGHRHKCAYTPPFWVLTLFAGRGVQPKEKKVFRKAPRHDPMERPTLERQIGGEDIKVAQVI